jgi:hypothetical chaperone protein
VIVGRPMRFAGARPDPALALTRYGAAVRRLGFTDIRYALEPVAAALYFARRLNQDASVLVADFYDGARDFSIIRFQRRGGALVSIVLGQSGVAVAGDAFEFRIIDHPVLPALGKGSGYRDVANILPAPPRYHASFARGDQLPLMRTSRNARHQEPAEEGAGTRDARPAVRAPGRRARLTPRSVGLAAEGGAAGPGASAVLVTHQLDRA